MTCERLADLLDPYLDGETDALTTRTLEDHLAQCASCSRKLAARRALQQALQTKLPIYTAPIALRASLQSPLPPLAFSRHLLLRAIAASLLLFAGIALGFLAASLTSTPRPNTLAALTTAIESNHLRSLQENHLFDVASTDQHTVKPWFNGKLPFAPSVPLLENFPLKGGRLDWINQTQAAALVYMKDKHTINLFIWQASGGANPIINPHSQSTPSGHHLIFWNANGLNYVAISDLEPTQLEQFATQYQQATAPKP